MAVKHGKDYVDFDMDFTPHPAHGDLSKLKKIMLLIGLLII